MPAKNFLHLLKKSFSKAEDLKNPGNKGYFLLYDSSFDAEKNRELKGIFKSLLAIKKKASKTADLNQKKRLLAAIAKLELEILKIKIKEKAA